MNRAGKSELMKLRTTNLWWLALLGVVAATVLALLYNALVAHGTLAHQDWLPADATPEQERQLRAEESLRYAEAHSAAGLARLAAGLYTSGQFLGLMIVMLVGVILVTGEYAQRTAAITFLATPRRGSVIVAKLVAAVACGVVAWACTAAVSIPAGVFVLRGEHVPDSLGRGDVTRSLALNLLAFAVWAVLGVGLGALFRSQLAAVVTGTVLYLVGSNVAMVVLEVVRRFLIKEDWVETAQVVIPAIASQIMTTPGRLSPHAPEPWAGAAVLLGYGIIASTVGIMFIQKRDIS
ncbi:MAG: ABC transporter permease subunit [Dactylosporangium sp.]|nr:ABC transporter permease subunit [Dactylosporangium sp.]NNJ61298.1 ABC transporter permease subunit [Dactylosporangium sp.]